MTGYADTVHYPAIKWVYLYRHSWSTSCEKVSECQSKSCHLVWRCDYILFGSARLYLTQGVHCLPDLRLPLTQTQKNASLLPIGSNHPDRYTCTSPAADTPSKSQGWHRERGTRLCWVRAHAFISHRFPGLLGSALLCWAALGRWLISIMRARLLWPLCAHSVTRHSAAVAKHVRAAFVFPLTLALTFCEENWWCHLEQMVNRSLVEHLWCHF